MTRSTVIEDAEQARFRYEHAAVEARRVRDAAIFQAWQTFEQSMAAEWAAYQTVMGPFEQALLPLEAPSP